MTLAEIRRHPDFAEARCEVSKLCDFHTVERANEAQVEECAFCHKRIVYRVVDGRIDSAKYARDHVRDVLQPGGRAYEEVYGSSWRSRKLYEKNKPTHQEIYERAKDVATFLDKMESRGHRVDKEADKLLGNNAA